MTENEKEMMNSIFAKIAELDYIKPDEIPNIALYMDQVTTFMEDNLASTKRHDDDKILTKTMINNYAKNKLLPPPEKKRYSREHLLMLIFIYYFKNLLSFHDIETFFGPITSRHFSSGSQSSGLSLEDIYREVSSLEEREMEHLKADVSAKFSRAMDTFKYCPAREGEQEYLRLFSFICELSFDVYLKMRLIEKIADQLREDEPPLKKK